MLGLDDVIASLSDGTSVMLVALAAVLLGLRHASDPDHLAAVATLVASRREQAFRRAAGLGVSWGLGHAATLFVFGLPIVVFEAYLPPRVQQAAETSVGVVIVALAVWLLVRWRRGLFHPVASEQGRRLGRERTPIGAFAVGLLHGTGGSAGVGVLVIATVDSPARAAVALAILALFTAVSMTALTAAFGRALAAGWLSRSFHRAAPVLGTTSLAFGVWYALGALSLAPYYF